MIVENWKSARFHTTQCTSCGNAFARQDGSTGTTCLYCQAEKLAEEKDITFAQAMNRIG